jgi:hypothetical protein
MQLLFNYTVDWDEDAEAWVVTKRYKSDNMPADICGHYTTKAQAVRSAANRRYAQKTRRPVMRIA